HPGFNHEIDDDPRRQRREGRGFHHRGAAGRDRWRDLARDHRHREVPRRDEHGEPDRSAAGEDRRAPGRVLAVGAGGAQQFRRVPADIVARVLHLTARFGERLPHLGTDDVCEPVLVLDQQVVGVVQDLRAVIRGRSGPCLPRLGGDAPLRQRLVRGRRGQGRDPLLGGGVEHVEFGGGRGVGRKPREHVGGGSVYGGGNFAVWGGHVLLLRLRGRSGGEVATFDGDRGAGEV